MHRNRWFFLVFFAMLSNCQGREKASPAPVSSPAPMEADPASRTAGQPAAVLEDYTSEARKLVESLQKKDYAAVLAGFDATMARMLDETKLKATWEQLLSHTGGLKRQVSATREVKGLHQMISVLCEFEKAYLVVKVTYDKDARVAGLFFAPAEQPGVAPAVDYIQADRFTEESVTFGHDPFRLPGLLCLPRGNPGPFAAAVLVHGSGPNDRDETIGPNKPFRDIAQGLCSAGFAVLRYDKRSKVHAALMMKDARRVDLNLETIDDVKLAVAFLEKDSRIRANGIFVIGHSLGAMAAPAIARDLPQLAGIVMMAANARPLEDLVVDQVRFLSGLDGRITDEEKAALEKIERQARTVKDPALSPDAPPSDLLLGLPAAYWLFLRNYDPVATARALRLPILILQGERDYQVSAEKDFSVWKKELGTHANVRFRLFAGLNHLFMQGEGVPGPSEYMKPGRVAPEVLETIIAFMKEKGGM